MRRDAPEVHRSDIDEARFGMRIARAPWMTQERLPEALQFCRENQVSLLFSTCLASDRRTYQAMEGSGFLMMETMLCLEADLTKPISVGPGEVAVRPVRSEDFDQVERLAAYCFKGYESHYHADDRLDRAKCDEIYVDWARRACRSREVANEVLVAESNGSLVGYFIMVLNSAEEADVAVAAVVPDKRGGGAYRALVIESMKWGTEHGAKRITGLVQLTNIAVQKTPFRLGWVPTFGYHTFHKWFD